MHRQGCSSRTRQRVRRAAEAVRTHRGRRRISRGARRVRRVRHHHPRSCGMASVPRPWVPSTTRKVACHPATPGYQALGHAPSTSRVARRGQLRVSQTQRYMAAQDKGGGVRVSQGCQHTAWRRAAASRRHPPHARPVAAPTVQLQGTGRSGKHRGNLPDMCGGSSKLCECGMGEGRDQEAARAHHAGRASRPALRRARPQHLPQGGTGTPARRARPGHPRGHPCHGQGMGGGRWMGCSVREGGSHRP